MDARQPRKPRKVIPLNVKNGDCIVVTSGCGQLKIDAPRHVRVRHFPKKQLTPKPKQS